MSPRKASVETQKQRQAADMIKMAASCQEDFEIRYIVYRDLRQRGYIVKPDAGEFDFRVRIESVEVSSQWGKVGLMARSTLEADSPHVNVASHGDGLTSLQLAFREASTIPDATGEGPGERFTGSVV